MKCTACNGKGFATVWRGEYWCGDFIGDPSGSTPANVVEVKCSRCNGTGKFKTFKHYATYIWWVVKAKLYTLLA